METPPSYLGETYALLAACSWAIALIFFKRSGVNVSPMPLNLFKNVVGIVLLSIAFFFVSPEEQSMASMTSTEITLLAISGILGIAFADTLLFFSLNKIGVGLLAIVECSYAPLMIFFAWLMAGEHVSGTTVIGGLLVISAVFVATGRSKGPSPDADADRQDADNAKLPVNDQVSRKDLIEGVVVGVLAIALMAIGIAMVKSTIESAPLLPVTIIRLVAGSVVLAAIMGIHRRRREWFGVFIPSWKLWTTCIPAGFFGTFLALMFWVGGFKYTTAARAAILNQTSTIMALIFATIFLKEAFTKRKFAAAIMAFLGVLVVTLGQAGNADKGGTPHAAAVDVAASDKLAVGSATE
ncbi:MAG: DMT family transporter [Phycisphaerae bacterium]